MAEKFTEKKTAGRLQPAPTGTFLVNLLNVADAEIKNDQNPRMGDAYFRITYRVFRAKPDSSEVTVLPGTVYGNSIFRGKDVGRMNTDLADLYAAGKSADGDPTQSEQICVKKETREKEPARYKFSIEELVAERWVPKSLLLLKRTNVPKKDGSGGDPYPRHDWAPPAVETQAALEAALARSMASPPAAASSPAPTSSAPDPAKPEASF